MALSIHHARYGHIRVPPPPHSNNNEMVHRNCRYAHFHILLSRYHICKTAQCWVQGSCAGFAQIISRWFQFEVVEMLDFEAPPTHLMLSAPARIMGCSGCGGMVWWWWWWMRMLPQSTSHIYYYEPLTHTVHT
jgi:hypothetical protein